MSTENTEPRRYAEDVDLDAQFTGDTLRAPEPEHDSPDPIEPSGVDDLPEDLDPDYAEFLRQKRAKASVIPAHAPRPTDRKAKASEADEEYPTAVMDEATGILMVTIRHDGLDLSIPADPEDWPIMATRAFEQGKIITAIENLLSTREFSEVAAKGYRNKDFGKLYERLARAGGFDNSGN